MFLSCSPAGDFLVGPPQLGGGVAATELELEIRKDISPDPLSAEEEEEARFHFFAPLPPLG